jgi:phage baseplate assembly protein W
MILSPKKAIGLSLPIQLGNNGYFASNTDSISQVADNIQNLLLTVPGERRFNNQFGSGLYNLLFQSIGEEVTKDIIVDVIQRDVDRFLNGTTILNVELSQEQPDNKDPNSIFISITFRYNNTVGTAEFNLNNNRL